MDDALRVLDFWFDEAGEKKWFGGGPAFDEEIAQKFGALYAEIAAGGRADWRDTSDGALARIIVLDQFSRNLFRKDPRAFAHDDMAVEDARAATTREFDLAQPMRRRTFFYMPFMHSEALADQEEGVRLFEARAPESDSLRYMHDHRDIIARFGRFPHRNAVLGRTPTPEETAYLEAGGFNPN